MWRPHCTLTAGQLAWLAPDLWLPAVALANSFAGYSAGEWAAAYVESTACLAESAGWGAWWSERWIADSARAVGVTLDVAGWRHLWCCYLDAPAGIAADYDVT